MPRPMAVRLTYQDYLRVPDDDLRHEILDGEHVVSPSAGSHHQRLQLRLAMALHAAIEQTGLGIVVTDLDVHLGPHDVVRPDILVVTTAHAARITATHVEGAPDLLIEILSPDSATRDRHARKARYEARAVPEYWIVDPNARRLEQYASYSEGYRLLGAATEAIQLAILPEVTIDLRPVW